MEIFKDVKGYEGLYQVSNLGNVKGLKRNSILKSNTDFHGYVRIKLCKEGKTKTKKIHKLVAIAFLNHTPNGQVLVVDHIDNNKLNNKLENLQVTTSRHNSSKDRKNKTSKYTGVSWSKKMSKWKTSITTNKKQTHLGYFENELDASIVYNNALINL